MKNLWNDAEAAACGDDILALRVYTSRLLGQDPNLVLHGGGNTSAKGTVTSLFGDEEEVLFVKGSGTTKGSRLVQTNSTGTKPVHDVFHKPGFVR